MEHALALIAQVLWQLFLFAITAVASYGLQRFMTTDHFPGELLFRDPLKRLAYGKPSKKTLRPRQPWLWLLELVSCPWCFGAWTTFAVFAGVDWWLRTRHGTGLALPAVQGLAGRAVVGWLGELEPGDDA
jgi:hypothetical protein